VLVPGPMWENDLSKLTPVPQDLLRSDQALRDQLGTPDLRYLLVIEAKDDESALTRLAALQPALRELVERGAIGAFDDATRYVPTRQHQLARQAKLPSSVQLKRSLAEALIDTPFRPDVFEPFIRDVEQARELPPLTAAELRASPLGSALDLLLARRSSQTIALVTFAGVSDPEALGELTGDSSILLDLKAASESLVAQQRTRLLWSLSLAVVLLIAVIAFALRQRNRVVRVLAPMALTTVIILAILHGAGVPLTLFHLIALILAAGLGLDYALFFEHAADDPHEQRRTLHAVLVCSISTLMVFALLALSSLPVLRAIGVTVSIGVVCNFVLALLLTREDGAAGRWVLGAGRKETAPDSSSGQRPAPSTQPPISSLIPHQGSMCLLERVVHWDDQSIRLATQSHRSPQNPLRHDGQLKAVHLCEYGAQAMAVHGALRAQTQGTTAAPGMLVSLRSVQFHCDRVDDLTDALDVEATCLQSSVSSQQYSFRITHADRLLAEGRAAVVLADR